MKLRNILWWLGFFIGGILLQRALPGIDILLIGLLIALQEQNPFQIVWVLLTNVIIQEGCGSLDFGVSILWYSCIIGLFLIGRWLFETENLLFIILLSICIGITKFTVLSFMIHLQNLPEQQLILIDESILQTIFTPIIWKLTSLTRRWGTVYET